MRPATLLHAFALFALALFVTVLAAPADNGALAARTPSQVEARSPEPSSNRRSLRKRSQRIMSEAELVSQYLCLPGMSVCPLSGKSRPSTLEEWNREGYECISPQEDLNSCGGCSTVDTK